MAVPASRRAVVLALLYLARSCSAFVGGQTAGRGRGLQLRALAASRAARGPFAAANRALLLPGPTASGTDRPASALPELPTLDAAEEELLRSGRPLRWQQPPGRGERSGRGFCVQELRADEADVWAAVSDFGRYPELISTVKTAAAYDGPPGVVDAANVCRYSFLVSRIRLRLDVRFSVDEAQRYASWQLDRPSWVLTDSSGYWRVQPCADRPGMVRVWFCVSVRLTARVPGFVIRLVSRLGLAKATRWLKELDRA